MTGDRPTNRLYGIAAKNRAKVRYRIGSRILVGTLVFWPLGSNNIQCGQRNRAKVITASGAYLSVDPEGVELIEHAA